MERLPVFVYGTLRVGGRFHDDLFAGAFTSVEPATLTGAVMWDNHGAYPYVALDPDGSGVTGELFEMAADGFEDVMMRLDHLEGHEPGRSGNHYERRVVEVDTAGGKVRAWVYVVDESSKADLDAELRRIPSGNWLDRPT